MEEENKKLKEQVCSSVQMPSPDISQSRTISQQMDRTSVTQPNKKDQNEPCCIICCCGEPCNIQPSSSQSCCEDGCCDDGCCDEI